MKEARLLRILRLPLITLLAINLAVLLLAPLYRTRQTSVRRSTKQAASQVVDRMPIASTQEEMAAEPDEDESTSPAAAPLMEGDHAEQQEKHPTDRTLAGTTLSDDVGGEQETVEGLREGPALRTVYGLDLTPLIVVGRRVALPRSAVEPFSRPIARAAGRVSQWLAAPPPRDHGAEELAGNQGVSASSTASRFVSETEDLPQDRIVLRNPRENRFRVAFLLDNQVQTLEPGTELVVDTARANIRFDRGSDYGESREVLEAGVYRFSVGKLGWRLRSEEPSTN